MINPTDEGFLGHTFYPQLQCQALDSLSSPRFSLHVRLTELFACEKKIPLEKPLH